MNNLQQNEINDFKTYLYDNVIAIIKLSPSFTDIELNRFTNDIEASKEVIYQAFINDRLPNFFKKILSINILNYAILEEKFLNCTKSVKDRIINRYKSNNYKDIKDIKIIRENCRNGIWFNEVSDTGANCNWTEVDYYKAKDIQAHEAKIND